MMRPLLLCLAVVGAAAPVRAQAPRDSVPAGAPTRDPFQPPPEGLPYRAPVATLEARLSGVTTAVGWSEDGTRAFAAVRTSSGFHLVFVGSDIEGWRVRAITHHGVEAENGQGRTPLRVLLPFTRGYATPTKAAVAPPVLSSAGETPTLPSSGGAPFPPGITQFPTLPLPSSTTAPSARPTP